MITAEMFNFRPGLNWSHEDGSEMLFDHLVDSNGIDLDSDDANLIKQLIQGNCERSDRKFIFDIVANKRNSIDVDKFDYIARDCHSINLKSSYDHNRLILMSRVINDEICYSHKEVYNIYEMFHMRYSLFKRVYTHKVSKAIEYMIVDAMLEADDYFQISNSINDPESYTRMTDDILPLIEHSTAPELEKARNILDRLTRRQLYKFVDEYTISSQVQLSKSNVTPHAILLYHPQPNTVKDDDVIIQWLKTSYGKGTQNPVDHVKFYGKWNDNESYSIPKNRVSYVIPEHYSEITIRIYTRNADKVPSLQKAFRQWLRHNVLSQIAKEENRGNRTGMVDVFSGNTVPYTDKEWSVIAQRWSPMKTPDAKKMMIKQGDDKNKDTENKNKNKNKNDQSLSFDNLE